MPISDHLLPGPSHDCYIHTVTIGGQDTAQYLVGRIVRQGTGDRLSPPRCLSGFDTDNTPFARGHVMALELGGCDDTSVVNGVRLSANIVPQYENWQGVRPGAWREMEVAVGAGAADVFIARLTYQPGPFAQTYGQQKADWNASNRLLHWLHPLIPRRFEIWALANNWAAGGQTVAAYFAANGPGKDAMVAGLVAAVAADAVNPPVFDAVVDAMPPTDRALWRIRQLKDAARDQYHAAYAARETHRGHIQLAIDAQMGDRKRTRGALGQVMALAVPDSLVWAQWIQADANINAVHGVLQGAARPAYLLDGWSPVEIAALTPQNIRDANM